MPDKRYTFDHQRPYTKFEHLLDDYNQNITEHDLTHLEEILSLHDLKRDIPAGDFAQFKDRSINNHVNRCLHQHVFDFKLIRQIFDHLNLKIIVEDSAWPYHLIVVGVKK